MPCGQARYDPGGGGINVARIVQLLGASVSAVFPAGGPTGDLVTNLRERGAGPPDHDRRLDQGKRHRERAEHRPAVSVRTIGPELNRR